jgi:hypothetical protein
LARGRAAIDQLRNTIGSGTSDKMPDQVLVAFAEACQGAAAHEYALVARQVIVARRGRFDASDHPFFSTSLRALAPGDETETVLERLAGAQLHMALLTPRPTKPPTEDPSGFAVQAIVLYQDQNLLASRMGRDVKLLGNYINAIRAAAQQYFKTLPQDDGRALMLTIYLKPDRQARFWFTFRGDPLSDETINALREKFGDVPAAVVHDGPVAVGLLVNLWGGGENPLRANAPPADLLFPQDWQDAAAAAEKKLQIPLDDQTLALFWPD